jgi:hypothetical protein
MALFRVYAERTLYLEAVIEADTIEDARDMAQSGDATWSDATGGRGLGDDDYKVLDIEQIEDEDEDNED